MNRARASFKFLADKLLCYVSIAESRWYAKEGLLRGMLGC